MARLGGHRPDVAAPGKGQDAIRASCRSELGDDVAACVKAAAVELAPRRSDADEPIADRDTARERARRRHADDLVSGAGLKAESESPGRRLDLHAARGGDAN